MFVILSILIDLSHNIKIKSFVYSVPAALLLLYAKCFDFTLNLL